MSDQKPNHVWPSDQNWVVFVVFLFEKRKCSVASFFLNEKPKRLLNISFGRLVILKKMKIEKKQVHDRKLST